MSNKNSRILIVDDDKVVLAGLTAGLTKMGYAALTAPTGEQAVHVCLEEKPDLVLMDINLPGMSGIEAAQRLQRGGCDVPVVFLSALDDCEIVRQAIAEGGLGYLVKPVEAGHLAPAIEAALARAEDICKLKIAEEKLAAALAGERGTSVAVGVLMERHHLSAEHAFEALRRRARSQQRKIAEVAQEIVASAETLNFPEKNPGQ